MSHSLVFVDSRVADAERLLEGLAPGTQVVVLDPAKNGIAQMAQTLAGVTGLDAIHIISHGSEGALHVGNAVLTGDTLDQYKDQLADLGAALTNDGDILLYGCDLARGAAGLAFIEKVAGYTEADVAASTGITGARLFAGDWVLEATTGTIETSVLIDIETQQSYSATLASVSGVGISSTSFVSTSVSGDYRIDALISGFKWGAGIGTGATITYSFPLSGSQWANPYSALNEPADNLVMFSESERAVAREALAQWASVSNITFVEVAEAAGVVGDIRFAHSSATASATAHAYYPNPNPSAGDVWVAPNFNVTTSGGLQLLLHEIGHALGLKHPFEGANVLPPAQDHRGLTVMSYTQGNSALAVSPQFYDIAAIQYLYGVKGYTGAPLSRNVTITGGESGDVIISADGADQIQGRDGNDTITAGGGDDTARGGDGNDDIDGGAGIDQISGDAGDDILRDATGEDLLEGGSGNDTFVAALAGTVIFDTSGIDTLAAGFSVDLASYPGIENVTLTGSAFSAIGGSGNNSLAGNAFNNTLTGNAGNDTLSAGGGDDTLSGGDGDDSLDGGAGRDVLSGGEGNDSYVIDHVAELSIADPSGIDTIYAWIPVSLPEAGIEHLTLLGEADYGVGNAGANRITGNGANNSLLRGNGGADTIMGGDGNDWIDGESGNDSLPAGQVAGNDTLGGDNGDDTILAGVGDDVLFGGAGTDFLIGEIGNDLAYGGSEWDAIDGRQGSDLLYGEGGDDIIFGDGYFYLFGFSNDSLFGGDGNDIMMGEAGENSLAGASDAIHGEAGNDLLDGGGGNDAIYGGDGNDVIDGDNGNDYIVGGQGAEIMLGSNAVTYGGPTQGSDLFVYQAMADAGDAIYGFDTRAGDNDGIDLRALFDALGYSGTTPRAAGTGILQVVQSGADTLIQVDPDGAPGPAGFSTLATLVEVNAATVTDDYFLFQ